jgi:dienelactone hydrolase
VSAVAGDAQPTITVHPAARMTRAVAIVLPGGRADSFELTQSRHLSAVRMRPIARSLHRAGRQVGLSVIVLRYRYRGWNGAEMSPVADARWALDETRAQHGDVPVLLVGHSMGGRTALRVAGHESVRGVAALAPWLPDGEPVDQLAGREILIAHGTLDRVTSPRASRRFAERASGVAARVDYTPVRGDAHAMLLRAPLWHRLVRDFVLRVIG